MTRTWTPARAAAARFDRALDPHSDDAAAVDPHLLALVSAIRELPEVAPRPAHVADLRERLMAEAEALGAEGVGAPSPEASTTEDRLRLRPRPGLGGRRRATVAVGTLAVLGVGASVGVAAQTALPGESLYGVKRALEAAQTQVTRNDEARGEMLLQNASARLDETLAVLADPDDAAGMSQVTATLDSFATEARDASALLLTEYERTGRRSLVEQVRTFTARSDGTLTAMVPDMPAEDQDAWQRASEAVTAIDTDALSACPLCSADLQALALALPATPDFTDDPTDDPAGDPTGAAAGGGDVSPGAARSGEAGPDRPRAPGRQRGGAPGAGSGDATPRPGDTGTGRATPPSATPSDPRDDEQGAASGLGDTVRKLTDPLSKGLGTGLRGLGGDRDGRARDRDGSDGTSERPRRGTGGSGGSGSTGGGRTGDGPVRGLLDGVDDLLP